MDQRLRRRAWRPGPLGAGRVGIAALSLGLGEAALALGAAYAEERKLFGKSLSDFQNTQFVLADCRTELDAAWLLTLRAARLLDEGDKAASETSMAKLFTTEAVGRVVDRMRADPRRLRLLARLRHRAHLSRRARHAHLRGTSEVQRLVIARGFLSGA
ncbi:MAG: hypothetical protein IPG04_39210 [Polyangiaceae bacterium]|nr:hypothetical protein [Polyangiaceae bacterium]